MVGWVPFAEACPPRGLWKRTCMLGVPSQNLGRSVRISRGNQGVHYHPATPDYNRNLTISPVGNLAGRFGDPGSYSTPFQAHLQRSRTEPVRWFVPPTPAPEPCKCGVCSDSSPIRDTQCSCDSVYSTQTLDSDTGVAALHAMLGTKQNPYDLT